MQKIPLLLLCLWLQACTQTQKGMGETLRLALFGADDIRMTDTQLNSLPYASMYLRIDGGQQIFVVLGLNENGQQKWITRDRAMLVTEHGRLVKTLGLADNLDEVSNQQGDPLRDARHLREGASWDRTISWTENGKVRADMAVSRFTRGRDEVLQLVGKPLACHVWREDVSLSASGASWRNTFWVEISSGQVRRSLQKLGADSLTIEATILKPAT